MNQNQDNCFKTKRPVKKKRIEVNVKVTWTQHQDTMAGTSVAGQNVGNVGFKYVKNLKASTLIRKEKPPPPPVFSKVALEQFVCKRQEEIKEVSKQFIDVLYIFLIYTMPSLSV